MTLPSSTFKFFPSWTVILATVCICLASTFLLSILRCIHPSRPTRDIPGPVNEASWLYGNLPELLLSRPYGKCEFRWQEKYGSTYRIKGRFSETLLLTSDPTALRYIFNDARLFDFPPHRGSPTVLILGGKSLFAVRNGGDTHRRIKNMFSPAFTLSRLQQYIPVMRDVAREAVDILIHQHLEKSRQSDSNTIIDVYQLIQHVTSDIIGEVGFGHRFNAVKTDGGDEVAQCHRNIVTLGAKSSKMSILGDTVIPFIPHSMSGLLLHVPAQAFRTILKFRTATEAWVTKLLRDSLHSHDSNQLDAGLIGYVAVANKTQKRLSFSEICQQATGLLVAGQETTAVAIAWALYELAKRPEWQDQIREELSDSAQNMDSRLDKLEYLNAHIKETLRFHPSAPLTERMAFEDTILPLSQPITTTSGRVISELPIRKGQIIYIGVGAYNRDPHVWGPDAGLFQPLRWLDGRYDSGNLPGSVGPYSNLATFVSGARMCLGWRLAVLEMQVVLSELVSKFHFGFNPGQENDVTSSFAVTLVPLDAKSEKPSLALLVKPVQRL